MSGNEASSNTLVAVVTGANRGIGYGIVKHLTRAITMQETRWTSARIVLAVRNIASGRAAAAAVGSEVQLSANLDQRVTFEVLPVDLESSSSIAGLIEGLKLRYDCIDFFVNNAGVELNTTGEYNIHKTLQINYFGTLELMLAIIPLLRDNRTSRLLNIASIDGRLDRFPLEIRDALQKAARQEQITPCTGSFAATRLVENFREASANGQLQGYPRSAAYAVSKAALIAVTKAVARHQQAQCSHFAIASCCPGWVRTQLTGWQGDKDLDEGMLTPLHVLLSTDADGCEGAFWADGKIYNWEEGGQSASL